jgi:CheY-like chemotaxis protein
MSDPLTPALRVLVADDNKDTADTLGQLLGMWGYDVRAAYDGADALQIAETFVPLAAILDLAMPGLTGYDVARRIRRVPGLEHVLLICLSGYGKEEDRRRAYEAGFDHFLLKPADLEELRRLLKTPFSGRGAAASDPSPT